MTLDADLVVVAGDGVEFTFTVSNVGTDSTDLEFRSGLAADFAVFEDDSEIWRWSDGRMFTQSIQYETLASGESVTYTGEWPDPESGAYTAVATLEAENASVETTAEFAV